LIYGYALRAAAAAANRLSGLQGRRWLPAARIGLPLLALAVLVPRAITTDFDFSPIGGDHGAYDGIDDAAEFIRTLPADSILYDHWLGWELEYYLFERQLPVVWFPDLPTWQRNLTEAPAGKSLYLVAPWWAPTAEARQAVEEAGKHLIAVHESYRRDGIVSVTVFEIEP
ncbi:MAG: hypothetical protein ABI847_06335, partial [Anaerolineales bacterium]